MAFFLAEESFFYSYQSNKLFSDGFAGISGKREKGEPK
jgi:hypothetical protein